MASYVDTKGPEAYGGDPVIGPGTPGHMGHAVVGGPPPAVNYVQPIHCKDKKLLDAYILAVGLGFLGAHHFYLRRPGWGVLYLFTFGLLGVGYLVDICRLPCLVKDANRLIQNPGPTVYRRKSLGDAYLLWFPLGFFGLHHFYLRRWGWGVLYLFTFGLLGIGWLIDGIRMSKLVSATNEKWAEERPYDPTVSLSDAYVICLFPLTGLLGVHHYYLRRPLFGVLYTLTLGLLGVGWLVDICRLSCLVKRTNKIITEGEDGRKHMDDAYVCLFPLGFLGLHHFYLRRPGWGVLYLFTFGVFGIGWLVDFFRLPCLVNDYNSKSSEMAAILGQAQAQQGVVSPGHVNPVLIVTESVVPGAYPPPYQNGGYGYPPPQPYPQPYPQAPPGYPTPGLDSMSSIASSDVGHETPGGRPPFCPPSYQEATGDEGRDNSQNERCPKPPGDRK